MADGFLRDPDGRAAILRGMNVANSHKRKPYFGHHQAEDFRRIREVLGMNSVRLLTEWAAIEPEKGVYDDAYLDELAKRVAWAQEAGLLVIVDMHQDLYGEGFGGNGAPRWACDERYYQAFVPREPWFLGAADPNLLECVERFYTSEELKAHFTEAWTRVATRLRGFTGVLGFDVLNEPLWGKRSLFDFENVHLVPLYEQVVTAVRKVEPSWIAFLEPGVNVNLGSGTEITTFPVDNVAYAPHSYDAKAEAGEPFDPARRENVFLHVENLAREARALDAALWIGEYGAASPAEPTWVDYIDAEYDAAGKVAASTMFWVYELLDEPTDNPVVIQVLTRPYPERVAGDPVSYAWDETTSTFTLVYKPRRSIKAPTEIVVPEKNFPSGYHVECGGCLFEKGPDRLRLLTPPPGEPAMVSIRP
ncbi:MAG: cellulase family glycosylhydrolase [Deltaproteobacteria bacterium]|nr:cellulase family glycosylhydrolase [Deltaproteobacteria bacterium]